jgi:hypothetical protein
MAATNSASPGVTQQLIGVRGVLSPALFESCIAGGIVGVNARTPGVDTSPY